MEKRARDFIIKDTHLTASPDDPKIDAGSDSSQERAGSQAVEPAEGAVSPR